MRFLALCAGLLALAGSVSAQERETQGVGRIFNNDYFGDFEDRWRTGSYTISVTRGPDWQGDLPRAPGQMLEYRLRSEIIAPQELNGPLSGDRAYVGAVTTGVHTHFERSGVEMSAGLDLTFTGPATGLSNVQDQFHDLVSAPSVGQSVEDNQVENGIYPSVVGQAVYPLQVAPNVQARPFVELQYGVEDIARVGIDVLFGLPGQQDLWLRDNPTGQLYAGAEGAGTGTSFAFGLDYAAIGDSAYFPDRFGSEAEDDRLRLRGGVHTRFGEDISLFYGATYLSEEFIGQPEGQIVGSLKLFFNF